MIEKLKLSKAAILVSVSALVSVFLSPQIFSQALDAADIAVKMSKQRAANQEAIKAYNWKSRTELVRDGEVRSVSVDLVRYSLDGQLQRTKVGGTPPPSAKNGLRGRLQKKNQKKQREWSKELRALLTQYSLPTTGKLLDFFDSATVVPGSDANSIRLRGTDVVVPGDELVMVADREDRRIKQVRVKTTLDGDVVLMQVDHATLSTGLGYTAKSVVRVPSKKVGMTIENFDYNKDG